MDISWLSNISARVTSLLASHKRFTGSSYNKLCKLRVELRVGKREPNDEAVKRSRKV